MAGPSVTTGAKTAQEGVPIAGIWGPMMLPATAFPGLVEPTCTVSLVGGLALGASWRGEDEMTEVAIPGCPKKLDSSSVCTLGTRALSATLPRQSMLTGTSKKAP